MEDNEREAELPPGLVERAGGGGVPDNPASDRTQEIIKSV